MAQGYHSVLQMCYVPFLAYLHPRIGYRKTNHFAVLQQWSFPQIVQQQKNRLEVLLRTANPG